MKLDKGTIVVHCPIQEDWDYMMSKAVEINPKVAVASSGHWNKYKSITCFYLSPTGEWLFADTYYAREYSHHVISIAQFKLDELSSLQDKAKTTQVGDVNSNEKGSGARYNNGKPDYSMLVLEDYCTITLSDHVTTRPSEFCCLNNLSEFQKTHEVNFLFDAIRDLGHSAVEESAYVFSYGAKKYAAWNWTKGMKWSIPLACAVRHLTQIIIHGEECDIESGRKHTGHVVCNIMMLIHYARYYQEGNDLPSRNMFKEE